MKHFVFRLFFLFFISFFVSTQLHAQDTLPKFTATIRGSRVIVSWDNPYENLIQVAVQRSYDSTKKFNTVYSAPSPELPVNGFSEQIQPGVRVYYRIFYVLAGGNYFFSKSKKPVLTIAAEGVDNTPNTTNKERRDKASVMLEEVAKNANKKIFIKLEDLLYATLSDGAYLKFRDSIIQKTQDTLYPIAADTILIKKYVIPYSWAPSKYVFTDRNGYLKINLIDAAEKQYEITITEEDGTHVLDLKQLKEPLLFVDKTNFYHAGWYKFILYENGKLKEKGRFLLDREF